jgi:5-dehydro-2-deoxygluconokinase
MLEPEIGPDFGGLSEWPLGHVVKVLCFCHPDDDAEMWARQEETLLRLFTAARRNRLEFLLEVIPSKVAPVEDDTTARIVDRIYALGIHPDWWKLEPFRTDAAWAAACDAITRHDPHVRGIVVLGLDAPAAELEQSFQLAARQPLVKGFAVGRTIFADAARAWLNGRMTDGEAVAQMADRFRALADTWDRARAPHAQGQAA